MILRSFKKLWHFNKYSWFGRYINIWELEDYVIPAPEEQFHLETSSSGENEDKEWVTDNEDNGNNNDDTDFEESGISDDESKH